MSTLVGLFARSALLGGLGLATLGCSATAPDTQYPPPPPSQGLPFIPFETDQGELLDMLTGEDDGGDQAGDTPPSGGTKATAVSGDLPSSVTADLSRKASCTAARCEFKQWIPVDSYVKSTPGDVESPAALWLQEIKAGSSVVLPRNHLIDVMAVVLSGELIAIPDDGGRVFKLGAWHTLRAPGAGLVIKASNDAKLIIGVATSKGTLSEVLAEAKAKPWGLRWKKRATPVAAVNLAEARDLAWGGGAYHARIGFGGEGLTASSEVLLTGPDAGIPSHDHTSWENIAVLQGKGTMLLSGKEYAVAPGAIFQIPKGVKHAYKAGGEGLVAVQMYAPAGPEQRFEKLAGDGGKPDAGKPSDAKPAPKAKEAPQPAAKPAK